MASQRIVCTFDREEHLVGAAAASRERGLTIADAYTPYPVHGLAAAMGLPPSRLPWLCFALAVTSGAAMLLFQYWASAISWPTNIGGRPWNSFPAFVPVTFEFVVLVAGVGTVAAFMVLSFVNRSRSDDVPDARVTDDRFALVLIARNAEERARAAALVARFQPLSVEEREG
jgi:hypothetical protein